MINEKDLAGQPDDNSGSEIDSILKKINDLVSFSGNEEDIDSKMVSFSTVKTGELKDTGFSEAQLHEIKLGIDYQLKTDVYAKKCYNWMQMQELRLGLMEKLDTSFYEDPLYSAEQMKEIRLGLMDMLDVSSYSKLILSATDMRNVRKILFAQAYDINHQAFGKTFVNPETGITFRISNDCMNAYITIPADNKTVFTTIDIIDMLHEHDITYGINEKNIAKMLKNRTYDKEVCIATGKRPLIGNAGYYELFFDNSIENAYAIPPDDEFDYTNINTVDVVEPGQRLAKYHPAQKNLEGMTVTGLPVNGVMGDELPPLSGSGFEYDAENDVYIASKRGHASYDHTTCSLSVWMVYEIHGDVGLYQNMEYDGSVHVLGSVKNLAVIHAKGDIIIDGYVENAHICAEQNVVVKGGVNGGGYGIIDAGGSIRGKFFEYVTLNAKGLVESNYFLNCSITTDDRVIARGKKARLMGGKITACLGVEAVVIGNYLSSKTIISVGDLGDLDKRILFSERERKKILDELQQLSTGKQKLSLLLGEKQASQNALYVKTLAAIHTKETQLTDIDTEIARLKLVRKRAQKAYVHARSELQQDVTIIISGNIKKVDKPMKKLLLTKEKFLRKI